MLDINEICVVVTALMVIGIASALLLWRKLRADNEELARINRALVDRSDYPGVERPKIRLDLLQPWLTPALVTALLLLGVSVHFAFVVPTTAAGNMPVLRPLHANPVDPSPLLNGVAETSKLVSVPDREFPPRRLGDCTPLPLRHARAIARRTGRRVGVSSDLILAVIYQESRFAPCVVSTAGAQGLMQLKPSTALDVGVKNSFDPEDNIVGGARYLRWLLDRYGGDVTTALRAYLAGPGTVERMAAGRHPLGTQEYVDSVLEIAAALSDD